jgi:hypothetical protein
MRDTPAAASSHWMESEPAHVTLRRIKRAGAEREAILSNADVVSGLGESNGESRGGERKLKVE